MPFKQFDLALTHTQGFLLWTVKVLQIAKIAKAEETSLLSATDHKEIRLTEKVSFRMELI